MSKPLAIKGESFTTALALIRCYVNTMMFFETNTMMFFETFSSTRSRLIVAQQIPRDLRASWRGDSKREQNGAKSQISRRRADCGRWQHDDTELDF
jgi:hypothetical protein